MGHKSSLLPYLSVIWTKVYVRVQLVYRNRISQTYSTHLDLSSPFVLGYTHAMCSG